MSMEAVSGHRLLTQGGGHHPFRQGHGISSVKKGDVTVVTRRMASVLSGRDIRRLPRGVRRVGFGVRWRMMVPAWNRLAAGPEGVEPRLLKCGATRGDGLMGEGRRAQGSELSVNQVEGTLSTARGSKGQSGKVLSVRGDRDGRLPERRDKEWGRQGEDRGRYRERRDKFSKGREGRNPQSRTQRSFPNDGSRKQGRRRNPNGTSSSSSSSSSCEEGHGVSTRGHYSDVRGLSFRQLRQRCVDEPGFLRKALDAAYNSGDTKFASVVVRGMLDNELIMTEGEKLEWVQVNATTCREAFRAIRRCRIYDLGIELYRQMCSKPPYRDPITSPNAYHNCDVRAEFAVDAMRCHLMCIEKPRRKYDGTGGGGSQESTEQEPAPKPEWSVSKSAAVKKILDGLIRERERFGHRKPRTGTRGISEFVSIGIGVAMRAYNMERHFDKTLALMRREYLSDVSSMPSDICALALEAMYREELSLNAIPIVEGLLSRESPLTRDGLHFALNNFLHYFRTVTDWPRQRKGPVYIKVAGLTAGLIDKVVRQDYASVSNLHLSLALRVCKFHYPSALKIARLIQNESNYSGSPLIEVHYSTLIASAAYYDHHHLLPKHLSLIAEVDQGEDREETSDNASKSEESSSRRNSNLAIEAAIGLHSEMIKSGIRPNIYTYNAVIHACTFHGDVNSAIDIYNEMTGKRSSSSGQNRSLHASEPTRRAGGDFHIHPDANTMKAIIKAAKIAGDIDTVEFVVDELLKRRIEIDSSGWFEILSALSIRNRRNDKAEQENLMMFGTSSVTPELRDSEMRTVERIVVFPPSPMKGATALREFNCKRLQALVNRMVSITRDSLPPAKSQQEDDDEQQSATRENVDSATEPFFTVQDFGGEDAFTRKLMELFDANNQEFDIHHAMAAVRSFAYLGYSEFACKILQRACCEPRPREFLRMSLYHLRGRDRIFKRGMRSKEESSALLLATSLFIALKNNKEFEKILKLHEMLQSRARYGVYNPDLLLYNVVLLAAVSLQDLPTALEIIAEMRSGSVKFDSASYKHALHACTLAEDFVLGRELIDEMMSGVRTSLVWDRSLYYRAMSLIAKLRDADLAWSFICEINESKVFTQTTGSSASVSPSANDMHTGGSQNDSIGVLYTLALQSCRQNDNVLLDGPADNDFAEKPQSRPDVALQLLADMHDRGYEIDSVQYTVTMSILSDVKDLNGVIELKKEMESRGIQPNRQTYIALMVACGKAGRWESVLEFMNEMATRNVEPDVASYAAAIQAVGYYGGQWRMAVQLFEEMQGRHIAADKIVYNAVIRSCGNRTPLSPKNGRYDFAKGDTAAAPSTVDYCSVGPILEELNDLSDTNRDELFDQSPGRSLGESAKDSSEQLAKEDVSERLATLQQFIDSMTEDGRVDLDEITMTHVIQAYGALGDLDSAMMWFRRLQKSKKATMTAVPWTVAMIACASNGSWKRVVDLLVSMNQQGITVTEQALCAAFNACRYHAPSLQSTIDLLHWCEESLSDVCGAQIPADLIYRLTMTACRKYGDLEQSISILDRMEEKGLGITSKALCIAINICGDASKILSTEERTRMVTSLLMKYRLISLMQSCTDDDFPIATSASRAVVVCPDADKLFVYNAALVAFKRCGAASAANQVLHAMKLRGHRPNHISYAAAIRACKGNPRDNWSLAKSHLDDMRRHNEGLNSDYLWVCGDVVEILWKAGRYIEAQTLADAMDKEAVPGIDMVTFTQSRDGGNQTFVVNIDHTKGRNVELVCARLVGQLARLSNMVAQKEGNLDLRVEINSGLHLDASDLSLTGVVPSDAHDALETFREAAASLQQFFDAIECPILWHECLCAPSDSEAGKAAAKILVSIGKSNGTSPIRAWMADKTRNISVKLSEGGITSI